MASTRLPIPLRRTMSAHRPSISHLPWVFKRNLLRNLNEKYCIMFFASGRIMGKLVLDTLGKPTHFSLTIRPSQNRRWPSCHIEIGFRNRTTALWNLYPHTKRFEGKKICSSFQGFFMPTFDSVDDEARSCFNSYFPRIRQGIVTIIDWLVKCFQTNLTHVTFVSSAGKDWPELFGWNQLIKAGHLHFDQAPREFYKTDVFQRRMDGQMRTTFDSAQWLDSVGITKYHVSYVEAEILTLGTNELTMDDAFEEIQRRIEEETLKVFSFIALEWTNSDFTDLWDRLKLVPTDPEFFSNNDSTVSFWRTPLLKQGVVTGRVAGRKDESETWVFYFSRNRHGNDKIEMARWKPREEY